MTIVRFDITSPRADSIDITVHYHNSSVLGISNSEVVYSSGSCHLVKARYIQSNESHYSLNEEYHQVFSARHDLVISRFGENNETIWFLFEKYGEVNLFQYNATSFSLIGTKFTLFISTDNLINMDVAGEII